MKKAVLSAALASFAALAVVACNDVPTAPSSPSSLSITGRSPLLTSGIASQAQLQVCLSATSPATATYSVNASNVSGLYGNENLSVGANQAITPGNCILVIQKQNESDVPLGSGIYPPATDVPVITASVPGSWTYECVSPESVFCPSPAANTGNTATHKVNFWHGSTTTFDFVAESVPCAASSITSDFNGTAIPAGRYVWFNSTAKISGATAGTVIDITNSSISFTSGVPVSVLAPPTRITFAAIASPLVAWNAGATRWDVTLPLGYDKDMFLGGVPYLSPGLPGGIKPVTWSASFSSSTPGVKVSWKWAAAVFTSFSDDPGALGVGNDGKPMNFKGFAVGGARGGGASNLTGSWSATKNAGVCTL